MKRILAGVLLLLSTIDSKGQEVHGDPNVWFFMLNHYSINEKWRIGNELHVRRNDWIKEQEQFLIRPYVDYKLNDNVSFTVGYTYIKNSQFGKYPLPTTIPENNIWEQVTLTQKIGKLKIMHRYRQEHRFIGVPVQETDGSFDIDGTRFTNRFRYRLTLFRDLTDDLFVHVFDEIWFHQDGLKPESFDRNWLYAGAGYRVARNANVQLGFLHQWIKATADRYAERPTVQLMFQYDF